MVTLTRTQKEAIEKYRELGYDEGADKIISQAEKQQEYSSYKGGDPKITTITDDTPVGVYDLEKTQTAEATPYESLIMKDLSSRDPLQSTNTNPQTVNEYLMANQGKDELLYFQSTDTEFKATAIAKPKPKENDFIKPKDNNKKVDKSKFTPDGKIESTTFKDKVGGYFSAIGGAFKSGFGLKPYEGGTGNIQTESGLTNLGYAGGIVTKTVTLSPAVWEGLGYNVAKFVDVNPQYQPYLATVGNFFSSRPVKTTLWTLYGVSRSVDLAQQTRADGSVGFARSGLGTTAGLSPVFGISSGAKSYSIQQSTPYVDSVRLETVSQGDDFKSLLKVKGGVLIQRYSGEIKNIPYKETQTLTGTVKNINTVKLGKTSISLDKVQIDSRGITNLGGKLGKTSTQYKVVAGSTTEGIIKPVKLTTETGKTTKYTLNIGKTNNVYDFSRVTGTTDDVATGLSKSVGKDKSGFVSINYGQSGQVSGTFTGTTKGTTVKYPYTENINTAKDLPIFSSGNIGAGTITKTTTSGGTVSKIRLQELLSNLDKAQTSLTTASKTSLTPIPISKTPETEVPSGGLNTPTTAESKTSTTTKSYNIITPVSFTETQPTNKAQFKPVSSSGSKSDTNIITESVSDTDTTTRSRSSISSSTIPSNESIIRAREIVETGQDSITRQRQNLITESLPAKGRTSITGFTSRVNISIPPASSFGLPPPFIKPTSTTSGFNVLVRSKGIFKRVNPVPLSKADAINYGASRVGTTASATFKLQKTGEGIKGSTSAKGVLKDFYKKGELFIEKRGRRIKSAGELREITYKGISSPKKKKKKSLFGGFNNGIF